MDLQDYTAEECSKFCIGLVRSKHSGKCPRVSCMIRTDKFLPGDLKQRMLVPCRAPRDANGTSLFQVSARIYNLFSRFKLFLEPHALRDESAVDPRLPQIPVSDSSSSLSSISFK